MSTRQRSVSEREEQQEQEPEGEEQEGEEEQPIPAENQPPNRELERFLGKTIVEWMQCFARLTVYRILFSIILDIVTNAFIICTDVMLVVPVFTRSHWLLAHFYTLEVTYVIMAPTFHFFRSLVFYPLSLLGYETPVDSFARFIPAILRGLWHFIRVYLVHQIKKQVDADHIRE